MNLLDYDTTAPGLEELAPGRDVLAQMLAEVELPIVSANAEWKDGAAVVAPYTICDVGDHQISVLGLTTPPDEPSDATCARAMRRQSVRGQHAVPARGA